MCLLSAVWVPAVSAYSFRRVSKLCDAKDETVSLWNVCFDGFMGGPHRQAAFDAAGPGETDPFLCHYNPGPTVGLPPGDTGRKQYGGRL